MLVLPGRRPLVLRCRTNAPDSVEIRPPSSWSAQAPTASGTIRRLLETRAGAWSYGKRPGGMEAPQEGRMCVAMGSGGSVRDSRLTAKPRSQRGNQELTGEPWKGGTMQLRCRDKSRLRSHVDRRSVGPVRAHCQEDIAARQFIGESERSIQ